MAMTDHSAALATARRLMNRGTGGYQRKLAAAVIEMAKTIETYERLERERWESARQAFGDVSPNDELPPVSVRIPPHETLPPKEQK